MSRIDTFTFRVNPNERRLLAALAERLQRSQSDAVRWLVREAACELGVFVTDDGGRAGPVREAQDDH